MTEHTRPNDETRKAGAADAAAEHEADRPPTPDEEEAAPTEVDESAVEAYKEMAERGAATESEGRVP